MSLYARFTKTLNDHLHFEMEMLLHHNLPMYIHV